MERPVILRRNLRAAPFLGVTTALLIGLLLVVGVGARRARDVRLHIADSLAAPVLATAVADSPRRVGVSVPVSRKALIDAHGAASAGHALVESRGSVSVDDPDSLSLRVQLQHACRPVAERELDVIVGPLEDPERDPARRRLASFCRDFQADDALFSTLMASHPLTIDQTHGRDAAVARAREWLATRDDAISLGWAAEFLLSADHDMRIPGPRRGRLALGTALHLAALRRECRRDGGCGADDFRTIAYCARQGCAAGADMERALRESMPARDWATLAAMDA